MLFEIYCFIFETDKKYSDRYLEGPIIKLKERLIFSDIFSKKMYHIDQMISYVFQLRKCLESDNTKNTQKKKKRFVFI